MGIFDFISFYMYKKLSFFLILIFSILSVTAQEKAKDSLFDKESKTFMVLPLVTSSPAMKTGFGAMPMYFLKLKKDDALSTPSLVALYGLYTTNNSYVFVPMAKLFWNENRNKATIFTGTLRVNNDFTYDNEDEEDLHLVFSELRYFLSTEYSRRIIGDFYLGLLYLGTKTNYKFDKGADEENEFTEAFFEENGITDNFVSSIGFNVSFDNLDYAYNPTKGLSFSIRPKFNREWLGSDNDYVDTDFNASYFITLSPKGVLGFGLAGGFATGDIPFDGYQNYGVRNSLRGYTTGKYKGKHMVAFQTEYRRNIYKRWGGVAFIGTGSVWGNEDNGEESFERNWLPSAGLGARFMISREKKINLRLDYAIGVDGNQGLYFGIMEAF